MTSDNSRGAVGRRLDAKLARIQAGTATRKDFIIADAKDADMAFGIAATGIDRATGRPRSLAQYRDRIRAIVRQDVVDIMLLSASNLEALAIGEGIFKNSPVTPAARANDSTDIWDFRGASYPNHPSRPFRSASIEHIKYGRFAADCSQPAVGTDLGLYSVTFTNDIEADLRTLEAFKAFRHEAEIKNFRYFLEVFGANVDTSASDDVGASFLNDCIIRTLAGVTSAERPIFLKIPFNGPKHLEELASYDPKLIVGILGGSAGTTFDAFALIRDARKYGAWVALFGRKINLSEHPPTFIKFLRSIADGEIGPEEAVRAYHDVLKMLSIVSFRSLDEDLLPTRKN